MKKLKWIGVLVLASLVVLSGCTHEPKYVKAKKVPVAERADSTIVAEAYKAADNLAKQSGVFVDDKRPIVVASFSNIDDLSGSTTFGRMISQKISSRLTQKAYSVVELLLRKDVYIRQKEGEFLLSRAVKNISSQHNAQAVVVGTYAVAKHAVFVTAKVVRTEDNVVLGSTDFTLPMTDDMSHLIGK